MWNSFESNRVLLLRHARDVHPFLLAAGVDEAPMAYKASPRRDA